MSEMISQFHEKQVVLGKEARNQEYVKKVDVVAENIFKQNVLNPKTESDKKSQYGRAEYLVNSLGGQGEFRANSVEGLKNVLKDDKKTEAQKEIAQERLSILEKGVFIVMRWGGDEKLQDLLGKGSAVEIDNILPTPLKGLGEKVVKNIITSEPILNKLRYLDDIRENCDLENQIDRQSMFEEVDKTYKELIRTKGLNPDEKEQLQMVKTYLNVEMEELDGDFRVNEKRSDTGRGGRRIMEPPINLLSGKDDEQTSDQLGTYRALSELEGPADNSHEEISKWAIRVTDTMARGSLFFAGSWQQVGPYIERQIEALFAGDKSAGVEKRKAKEREYVQALLTCRIQEQAILHCDGDPSKYASFLPPPDVMNDYMWQRDTVNLVEGKADKKIGTIGEIRRYLRQKAYTPEGGLEIARGLGSAEEINIYAQELVEKIKKGNMSFKNEKNEDISVNLDSNFAGCEMEAARTALALFIVEDYAQWSLWSCKTSVEEDGLKKVPWMKAEKPKVGAPSESAVWTKRVMDKTGRMDWVQTWGADFPGSIGKTCVQHPYCQFMRPVDLYRVKSSWNEEILQPLEESLCDLALRKWAYDDKGNKKEGGARNMLSPSKVGAKDFSRWNSMVSTWVGKSQADALDNFKDWLGGAEQLKSLLQMQSNVLDLGGEIAGDIFYAKVKAFMSMQKDDFLKSLSIALSSSGDDIRELQAFKADLLGSTGFGEFGQLFESISRINLHMGTEKYYKGMAMLQTGVGDPEKALKLLSIKKKAIIAQGALNVLGGLSGQKKR